MFLAEPICVSFPALIKAHVGADGKRHIELEASNSFKDTEGDVILQEALLSSSDTFLKSGHIDIDHMSELGKNPAYAFLGIKNPDEWIIGLPTKVFDMGDTRTGIQAEIFRSKD